MTDLEGNQAATTRVPTNMEMDDGNDGDDNDEDEILLQDLPPLSSHVSNGKFWCTFAFFPLIFIALNVIILASWLEFDRYKFRYSDSNRSSSSTSNLLLDMFQANSFAVACVLLVDTIILVKATLLLEKDIQDLNAEEDRASTGSNSDADAHHFKHVNAKVSRRLDKFFGQKRRPVNSVLFNLLCVITVLCAAGSVACVGVYILAGTSTAKEHCSVEARSKNKSNQAAVERIPQDLQSWANSAIDRHEQWIYGSESRDFSFVHLSDGRTFFDGEDKSSARKDDEDSIHSRMPKILLSTGSGNEFQTHSDVVAPQVFTSIKGNGNEDSDLFCCFYRRISKEANDDIFSGGRSAISLRSVLCVAKDEDISQGFRNVSLARSSSGRSSWYPKGFETNALDGMFWFASLWDHYRMRSWEYQNSEYVTEFYTLDPTTMELKSIVNITKPQGNGHTVIHEFGGSCLTWFVGVSSTLAMAVVLPCSFWMMQKKKMTIGVAPVTIATCFVLASFNDKLSPQVGLATIIVTSALLVCRFPKWLHQEIVLHIHYSVIVFFSLQFFDGSLAALLVIIGCLTGIVLKHPVLEVAGWTGGAACIAMSIFQFFVDDEGFSFQYILLIPFSVVVGCGLVSTGRALRKYRAYINYYSRRLWFHIRTAERAPSHGSATTSLREQQDLTRRLID